MVCCVLFISVIVLRKQNLHMYTIYACVYTYMFYISCYLRLFCIVNAMFACCVPSSPSLEELRDVGLSGQVHVVLLSGGV